MLFLARAITVCHIISYLTHLSTHHKNQFQHILFKNQLNYHHPITVLTSTIFLHSSSLTITPTPPTQSPFPDHHNLYIPQSIPSIHHPANNTHQSSSFSVLHKLFLPFHSHYLYSTSQPAQQSAHQASRHIASYVCSHEDEGSHLPLNGRQVRPTPTFMLVGAHNNRLL